MILVRIRCRECRKVLYTVDSAPADWTGSLLVPSCPRHGGMRPRTFPKWSRRRHAAGKSLEIVRRQVQWEDLRSHVRDAQGSGRTIDVEV